jgi:hypothetical protein
MVSRAKGKGSKFFGGFKLQDRHGKDEFGGYRPCKPNPFLGLSGSLDQDKIEVQDPGSPRIEEHKVCGLPSIIKTEG